MQDINDRHLLTAINEKIAALRETAGSLEAQTMDFPALQRNLKRISASIKMLELNLSDALALDLEDVPGN
jgi:hypothetical protein